MKSVRVGAGWVWSVRVTVGSELREVLYDVVGEGVVVVNHECDALLAILLAILTTHRCGGKQ